MKNKFLKLSLIVVLSGMAGAANAQTNFWHDDFDQFPVGANSASNSYGAVAFNFTSADYGHPLVMITNNLPDTLPGLEPSYTHTNNCAFTFITDPSIYPNALNFGLAMNQVPVIGGNTNASLRAYWLSFDMAVQGTNLSSIGGFVGPSIGIYGPNSGEYYGQGLQTNVPLSFFPASGTGYQHYNLPLASFGTANAALLVPTNSGFRFFFAAYMAGHSYPGTVEIDLANIYLTMSNPPPPPPPILTVLPAKPGLRIFAQDKTATYNQEGFSSMDNVLSWVGLAAPDWPVSYSIKIGDFDTVDNYTLYVQFLQNGSPGDPYGVYNGQNAFVWSITHQSSGFTTGVAWKTNAPQQGTTHVALPTTATTSTTGRGTWTLTFTNDLEGTVTMPDGSKTNFSLPDETVASRFANPLIIDFGTAPNSPAGYGQYIDLAGIIITNTGYYENDDFTMDSSLDTSLWNPGFSLNAGSVILVSTNTPYWVNWTVPDDGFGLGTKASLVGGTNVWFSPAYYGSGAGVANTTPTLMGQLHKWTLIPKAGLPTVEGTPGGTPSTTGFFQLLNPAPSQ